MQSLLFAGTETPGTPADDGLKYYDQAAGSGEIVEKGKKVKVGKPEYPALLWWTVLSSAS